MDNIVKPCGYPVPTGYMGRDRQGKWHEYATEDEYTEMEFSSFLDKEIEKVQSRNEQIERS